MLPATRANGTPSSVQHTSHAETRLLTSCSLRQPHGAREADVDARVQVHACVSRPFCVRTCRSCHLLVHKNWYGPAHHPERGPDITTRTAAKVAALHSRCIPLLHPQSISKAARRDLSHTSVPRHQTLAFGNDKPHKPFAFARSHGYPGAAEAAGDAPPFAPSSPCFRLRDELWPNMCPPLTPSLSVYVTLGHLPSFLHAGHHGHRVGHRR